MKKAQLPSWYFLGVGFTHVQNLSFWAGSGLFHKTPGFPVNTSGEWTIGMVFGIVTLLVGAVFFRGKRLAFLRRLLMPSVIISMTGFLFRLWPLEGGASFGSIPFIGSACLGIGASIMFLLWADVFDTMHIEEAEIAVPLASLVVLAYALVMPLLPAGLDGVLIVASPVASGVTLWLSFRKTHTPALLDVSPGLPPQPNPRTLGRILVALFFFSVALCWNGVVSQAALGGNSSMPEIIGSLAGVFCVFAFTYCSVGIGFASLFRWLCPLATVALALNFWPSTLASLVMCSLSSVLDITIWVVTYLCCSRKARGDYDTSITRMALLLAASHAGACVGNVLATGGAASLEGVFPGIGQDIPLILVCLVVAATMGIVGRPEPQLSDNWRSGVQPVAPDVATRCETLSGMCGLTARESEVLLLLAAGRSQPYICEYLALSKSTVSTHVGHIYQKCGVHSRQEILDLLT